MSNVTAFEPRNLPLMELVRQKAQVVQHIIDNEGEISPEDEYLLNIANQLMEKKVDGVCVFVKKIIPAAYEALDEAYKAQKAKIERAEEWMDALVHEAIAIGSEDGKRIEGTMWRVRLQPNPISAEIVDEKLIPDFLKTQEAKVTIKVPYGHECFVQIMEHLKAIESISKENGGDFRIDSSDAKVNRKDITVMLKDNPDSSIPGVRMPEQTYHVRYEAGKADVSAVAKKSRKKKEVASADAEY